MLERARQPLLEGYDNALKNNGGWMQLGRARAERAVPDRPLPCRARRSSQAITAIQLQATAARYLEPDTAVEVLALPAGDSPH